MGISQRLADTFARMLGLPESKATEHRLQPDRPTNTAGIALPGYARDDAEPVSMIEVRHPDGRMTSYPPPELWADWVEWDAKAWPNRVARRYTLVPTICFNCESGCGLLAYVDQKTFEIRKLEGNPAHPDELVVLTRENFRTYYPELVRRALEHLSG